MNNINIALAYINGTENPLKVFCNLFIYVLNKADNQKLRIDEVKEALTKEFGLKVPNHIIKACARVLKNNNEVQILNSGEGYKFLKSNFDIKKFSDELLQRKIREENLINDLQEYLTEVGVELEIDEARECFVDFLISSNYAYNLFENGSVMDMGLNEKKISKEWYISQYIKKVEKEKNSQFYYILDIVQGLMIYVGLCQFSDYNQDKEEKFRGTSFYLDTKMMLRYLGYSWPELVQETRELVDLIRKEQQGNICIFQHTYQEIASALSNEIHALEYGDEENYELECFRKINSYKKDRFKLDLQKLERKITEEEKIEISEDEDVTVDKNKRYNLNCRKLSDYIHGSYPKWKANTVYNDVNSINQINIKRKGNYNIKFGGKNKLPIFVTTNYPLITCCKKFLKDEYKKEGREFVFDNLPIIADSALMYRLWLPKASRITDNMPALSLARIVHTAQQENEIFYTKFRNAIKDFKEYDDITLDDLSETYSSKLFEITAKNAEGNYENFTEEILAQSLEEFVTIQTSKKDKEIDALKLQVQNKNNENLEKKEELIKAYTKIFLKNRSIVCKCLCWLSRYWWLLSAVLIVGITQILNYLPTGKKDSPIYISWFFGALLLSKPYVVKILDKIVNKKVDIVTNCLKKCAQRSLINSFEKKSDENERKYREDIIEASFKILKIEL